ncbi:MAG: hypothetical protein NTX50_27360 [Candidatus Sumerlaeota bacterium]|nr:hypothetical protein [Candidatus Sumerlaeota bacterium]
MSSRQILTLLLLGALCVVCAGALLLAVWWKYRTSFEPSPLITDQALPQKFQNEVAPRMPPGYRIFVRNTRWNHDAGKGRFERSFEWTVLKDDNTPVEPKLLIVAFEEWIKPKVNALSVADDDASTVGLSRIIRYDDEKTTGEARYSVKPAAGATLTINGKDIAGNFLSLDIKITEQRKR